MSKIILCGVGSGMGCNISTFLKNKGHEISIISRGENGMNIAKELGAHYAKCDLKSQKEVFNAFEKLTKAMGGLDGVVHIAGGFYGDKKIEDVDEEFFHSALTNHATTLYNVSKAASMNFNNGGSIVVISASRNVYMNGNVGYAAGKGAVNYMVKQLSKEFAPRNIRMNAVSPGFIAKSDCGKTSISEKLIVPGRHDARFVSEAVNSLLFNEIVTGQILEVDSGFSMMVSKGLDR